VKYFLIGWAVSALFGAASVIKVKYETTNPHSSSVTSLGYPSDAFLVPFRILPI
jgi:hypothetical protein